MVGVVFVFVTLEYLLTHGNLTGARGSVGFCLREFGVSLTNPNCKTF